MQFFNEYFSINRRVNITKSKANDQDGVAYIQSLLTIINTTRSDEGFYTCEAKLDTDTRKEGAVLDLTFPAEFIPLESSYYVDKGHSIEMECIFKSMFLTVIFFIRIIIIITEQSCGPMIQEKYHQSFTS